MENQEKVGDENQQQNGDKVAKTYEANLKKLVAIVGGKERIYKQKKVGKDELATLVADMLKEQKETLAVEIKTELKALLDKKVALDKDIKAEEEKLAKLKQQKQKEFNEACVKVFAKVENIENLEKDYYTSLSGTEAKD